MGTHCYGCCKLLEILKNVRQAQTFFYLTISCTLVNKKKIEHEKILLQYKLDNNLVFILQDIS